MTVASIALMLKRIEIKMCTLEIYDFITKKRLINYCLVKIKAIFIFQYGFLQNTSTLSRATILVNKITKKFLGALRNLKSDCLWIAIYSARNEKIMKFVKKQTRSSKIS